MMFTPTISLNYEMIDLTLKKFNAVNFALHCSFNDINQEFYKYRKYPDEFKKYFEFDIEDFLCYYDNESRGAYYYNNVQILYIDRNKTANSKGKRIYILELLKCYHSFFKKSNKQFKDVSYSESGVITISLEDFLVLEQSIENLTKKIKALKLIFGDEQIEQFKTKEGFLTFKTDMIEKVNEFNLYIKEKKKRDKEEKRRRR